MILWKIKTSQGLCQLTWPSQVIMQNTWRCHFLVYGSTTTLAGPWGCRRVKCKANVPIFKNCPMAMLLFQSLHSQCELEGSWLQWHTQSHPGDRCSQVRYSLESRGHKAASEVKHVWVFCWAKTSLLFSVCIHCTLFKLLIKCLGNLNIEVYCSKYFFFL